MPDEHEHEHDRPHDWHIEDREYRRHEERCGRRGDKHPGAPRVRGPGTVTADPARAKS